METFLHEVAQHLLQQHGTDLSRVCVVFNNRRPGLFLRKCLQKLGPSSFFLPVTMGMDDIVRDICGLEIMPKEYLLFELYDIHRNLTKETREAETFDQFISFGETMINDFSEIDLYQADAAQLFDNLYELKAIGEWDISGTPLTPFQQNYLKFYRSLYNHYTQLHQRLEQLGKAYSGMAYRAAAARVDGHTFPYQHLYFVGFNALSTSEATIIQTLKRKGLATLLCDGDAYYFDNPQQEAGHFLRRLAKQFDNIGPFPDHFAIGTKKVTFVSSPEDLMQVKYAGDLLRTMTADGSQSEQSLQDTAVVLADESLLVPMLHSLPDSIPSVNVTMGYPLEQTAIHTLTLKLFSACKNMRRQQLYRNDLVDILSDTCASLLTEQPTNRHSLQRYLLEQQKIHLDANDLQTLSEALQLDTSWVIPLFGISNDHPDDLLTLLSDLAGRLQSSNSPNLNKKEAAALTEYSKLIDHFVDLQQRYGFINRIETLERIYSRMAHRISVPFYGEPLQGLQILGMLETRNLDFKRIILLSANEGILPTGRQDNTLIPFHLKTDDPFHLPTHEEKDAIYANHFYQLIQRAEEVYIVYSTQTDSSRKGEASRFVIQLQRELARTHPNIEIRQQVIQPQLDDTTGSVTQSSVTKDDTILQRIRQLSESGFSPSALNTYRSCSMRYYYQQILHIRESEDLTDSLDTSRFGTLVHDVLHQLYTPLLNRPLQSDALRDLLPLVDDCLSQHFTVMGEENISHGKTYLQQRVAHRQIHHLIDCDIKTIESGHSLQILALEQPLNCQLILPEWGELKLFGKADRIDLIDGHLRIVDYKTGKVDNKDLQNSSEKIAGRDISDKSFQVLMYSWLYLHDESQTTDNTNAKDIIESGIYPIGDMRTGFLPVHWDGQPFITLEQTEEIGNIIRQLVAEITDARIPFQVAEDNKKCSYCPYTSICPRQKTADAPAE